MYHKVQQYQVVLYSLGSSCSHVGDNQNQVFLNDGLDLFLSFVLYKSFEMNFGTFSFGFFSLLSLYFSFIFLNHNNSFPLHSSFLLVMSASLSQTKHFTVTLV